MVSNGESRFHANSVVPDFFFNILSIFIDLDRQVYCNINNNDLICCYFFVTATISYNWYRENNDYSEIKYSSFFQ